VEVPTTRNQFPVAPSQHRLYFLSEPQGLGSFRLTLGALGIGHAQSYLRRPSHHRSTDQRFLSQYVSKTKYKST
jgi:hypothetical protein